MKNLIKTFKKLDLTVRISFWSEDSNLQDAEGNEIATWFAQPHSINGKLNLDKNIVMFLDGENFDALLVETFEEAVELVDRSIYLTETKNIEFRPYND